MPSRASDQPLRSPNNPLVRRLRHLATKREPGVVLLEGPRVVRQAQAAGIHLELLVLREGERFDVEADRVQTVTRQLFGSLSQTETPQGVLAVGRAALATPAQALESARTAGWPLVVLDGVQDPGNVGAIARTAAAAGAPALAVLPGTADPHGAKAVRASAGHVFNLAVARVSWADLEGRRVLGSGAGGRPLAEVAVEKAEALVLGSEAHGLSRPLESVALPMAAGVESLNVAAAAAVLLYEVRRRLTR